MDASGPIPLLGHSDGAVIALLIAHQYPDVVSHLVFVSGVLSLDGWPAATFDSEVRAFMADSYAEVPPDGRPHHPVIVDKLRKMHEFGPALTVEDLVRIDLPVLKPDIYAPVRRAHHS